MIEKIESFNYLLLRKTFIITLLFCFGIGISYGQDKITSLTDSKFEKEWWYPLIKKHNIDASGFTFWSSLKPSTDDPKGYTALELGTGAIIKDSILTIKDPVFIVRENADDYYIVAAKSASHNFQLARINWENGTIESFLFITEEPVPTQSFTFSELSLDPKTRRMKAKKISGAVIH